MHGTGRHAREKLWAPAVHVILARVCYNWHVAVNLGYIESLHTGHKDIDPLYYNYVSSS